jgi:ABC-type multidrug transport system fused ATPase/permease subunit
LTVAHRLKTVIDYDRILVLDQGKIEEIGKPLDLLKKKGLLYSMCVESGDYDELYSIAKTVV